MKLNGTEPPSAGARAGRTWETGTGTGNGVVILVVSTAVAAVIRLRREGLSSGQIGDITGMSLATIEKYCRFADRKTSGQAALLKLTSQKRTNEQHEL